MARRRERVACQGVGVSAGMPHIGGRPENGGILEQDLRGVPEARAGNNRIEHSQNIHIIKIQVEQLLAKECSKLGGFHSRVKSINPSGASEEYILQTTCSL